jgi:membrane protein involved in colicin uptake
MEIQVSDLLVGLLVLVLGLVGLYLASGALDDEIYIFGLGLALFAAVFDIGLVKRHYDRMQAAQAEAKRHV